MIRRKKQAVAAAIAFALALVAALAGYAYWTTTGSGTGSAAAGTTTGITLHATFGAGIFPGGTRTVSFTADSTNPSSVRVGTVHLAGVTVDAGHSTCVVADFTMPDVVQNVEIPNGTGTALPSSGSLSYADTGVSQDACQGATVTLNLTST